MITTVAQSLAAGLKNLGVRYVFGIPSGNFVDYLSAIEAVDELDFILVSNESSAGFMADICWRLTGTIAAVFGTFGPGACNLTTGVCGGYLDRSPMLVFTDEMSEVMRHRTTQMNIDHQALFRPITKWFTRLEPGKVEEIIYQAAHTATSEVPGPVHIGLPAGMGTAVSEKEQPPPPTHIEIPPAEPAALEKMGEIFAGARQPVAALGITAVRAGVRNRLLRLLEKFQMPVVLTPMAKGLVPEDHPGYAGVLAHAMAHLVGETHQQADCIIGIGYDPVEINYEDWMPEVPLLHIDTRPADLDTRQFTLGGEVVGELNHSLDHLLKTGGGPKNWDLEALAERREAMFRQLAAPERLFGPRSILEGLRATLPADGILTCDVGAHLHLIGQQWKVGSPGCLLMTNGCSSMGFAMPAAIAAKYCCPDRTVACVVGDGGYYMMLGELATARRMRARVVFVVINDAYLSLIRIKQERKGYPRYGTGLTDGGFDHSDAILGIPRFAVRSQPQYEQALAEAFAVKGPAVVEAYISTDDYDQLVLKGNRP